MSGKLFLLPNVLDESLSQELFLPASVNIAVNTLQGLIAESEKSARRYLRRFLSHEKMAAMPLKLLNEHTNPNEIDELLQPLLKGEIWGLISDAGLPCIADPGAPLVFKARQGKVDVEALPGPCSLILALQISGFSGQHFSFHGYLPRDGKELEMAIRNLEAKAKGETQIWIEAPYRSAKMLELLKKTLSPDTYLCVAASLTLPNQKSASHSIRTWKTLSFVLEKEPAVFVLYRFP